MKKNLTVIAAFLLTVAAIAGEGIHFAEGNWDAIKAKAKAEQKYIFLDSYTDWCGWCKVMDKETFTDTTVQKLIHSKFVPIKREMEKEEEGVALCMKYHVAGFPTYLVFSPDGILVHKIIGYRPAPDFIEELETALGKSAPLAPGLSAAMDPGYPKFYKESFGTGKKRKFADVKTVTDFLDSQKDLFSEVCWSVMWRFPLNAKYENWIFENKAKLSELYGADDVEDVIAGTLWRRSEAAAAKNDQAAFHDVMKSLQTYLPDQYPQMSLRFSQSFYEKTGNWKGYASVTQSVIDTAGYKDADFINSAAWTIYESCEDSTVIGQAVKWMENVCSSTEQYAYEDTYAAILFKHKEYTKAEEVALHAIDLGKQAGEDVSSTEALLANIRLKIK